MKDLILLSQLQELENEIQEIKNQETLTEKRKNMADLKREYESIKKDICIKVVQYKELERSITRANLRNKNLNYEIKELQNKLYDGSIKDFKTYSKMDKEMEECKNELDTIETDLLNLMDEKVLLEKDIKKLKRRLIKLHELYQEERIQYHKKKEELQSHHMINSHKIEELLSDIQETFIMEYRDIKKRVQPALARIDNGVCSGCHMSISIILLKEIQRGDKLYTCENCGRILYMEDH